MAQLPPRASQQFSIVKCSTCGVPVPLEDAPDHVCARQPPVPKAKALLAKLREPSLLPPPQPPTPRRAQSPRLPPPAPSPTRANNYSPRPALEIPPNMVSRPSPSPSRSQRKPYTPLPEPDTKIGGEAGMAGVGRRGFQAAAQAALFAASLPNGASGMDGRRANAPRYLNISASPDPERGTPPLSPNSGYSSHSPRTPQSQSPISVPGTVRPARPTVDIVDATTDSFASRPNYFPSKSIDVRNARDAPPSSATSISPSSAKLPLSERLKNTIRGGTLPFPSAEDKPPEPEPPRSSSESDFSGLAYDDDKVDDDITLEGDIPQTSLRSSKSESSVIGRRARRSGQRFPSLGENTMSSITSPKTPNRPTVAVSNSPVSPIARSDSGITRFASNASTSPTSVSPSSSPRSIAGRPNKLTKSPRSPRVGLPLSPSNSTSSSYSRSSRSTARSIGAPERSMDTVFEDSVQPPRPAPTPPRRPSELPLKSALKPTGSNGASLVHANSFSHPPIPAERAAPKLPTRSRTTPLLSPKSPTTSLPSSASAPLNGASNDRLATSPKSTRDRSAGRPEVEDAEASLKVRNCTRCERRIEDGRWIKAEGAGVLCERCWKTMYLPKCRRCNRPIEKQAVSSADGQLKGKYHRECFNCHTCHKPFPDKEFYVFDGKPFCRYHYHEANDSLCSARSCGQPIEGACAVAHTGERFHPEHLVCEYEYENADDDDPRARLSSVAEEDEEEDEVIIGGSTSRPRRVGGRKGDNKAMQCGARLEEYFEVDGRMMCERHAMGFSSSSPEERELLNERDRARTTRAVRRTTQLIDLR